MRLLGFDLTVTRAAPTAPVERVPVQGAGSWWGAIIEIYAGAFQQNVTVDNTNTLLQQSSVYACISRISNDVSILRPMLMDTKDGIWTEVTQKSPAFLPVLRRPNAYQTRIQFLLQWMTAKLTYGNAYILKERDARNVVVAMYPLDSRCVTPLVTPAGDVYYEVSKDYLSGVGAEGLTLPASEIIHDRMLTFWHPLVGVAPLYACGMSATQARKIQNNSSIFFANMSRPSGILTAPSTIKQGTADRLKREFESTATRRSALSGRGNTRSTTAPASSATARSATPTATTRAPARASPPSAPCTSRTTRRSWPAAPIPRALRRPSSATTATAMARPARTTPASRSPRRSPGRATTRATPTPSTAP